MAGKSCHRTHIDNSFVILYCWSVYPVKIFANNNNNDNNNNNNNLLHHDVRCPSPIRHVHWEVFYLTNWYTTFRFNFYLTGVHFRGKSKHIGDVGGLKIKCGQIRIWEKNWYQIVRRTLYWKIIVFLSMNSLSAR